MARIKVSILYPVVVRGAVRRRGEVVEVSAMEAETLLRDGRATLIGVPDRPPADKMQRRRKVK